RLSVRRRLDARFYRRRSTLRCRAGRNTAEKPHVMNTFLGIYREPSCSPGRHLENDAIILELVAEALETRGHAARLATVDEAARLRDDPTVVFSMCRLPTGLDLLGRWEREGKTIVNRAAATLETARSRLAERIFGDGVRLPATRVVSTARGLRDQFGPALDQLGCWVKGGELAASTREDVHRVETMQELERVLDDFERRTIRTAVLQEHVPGREIKFYAVGSGDFFHWLDVGDLPANPTAPDSLNHRASRTGLALNLEVFGGDVVIDERDQVALIDLND